VSENWYEEKNEPYCTGNKQGLFNQRRYNMARLSYPSDLSDKEWSFVEPLLPVRQSPKGRAVRHERREILNAIFWITIFWITAAGCAWRMLAHDFPAWKTVYHYFRLWRKDGTWQRIHDEIRTQVRLLEGHEAEASTGAIDSQSVKAVALRGDHGMDDVHKQTRGINRHLLVDTLGFLIAMTVTNALVQDRDGAKLLFAKILNACKRLKIVWADGGYRSALLQWVKERFEWILEIVLRPDNLKGFVLLPKCWIVERTNAWLGHSCRLNRQHEVLHQTHEAFVYIAMTRIMLRRLNKAN
jgi:putative transposase